MYETTSEICDLPPQEVEIIVDLLESRTWDVLLKLQDKFVRNPAYTVLHLSTDLNEMLRAQGILKAFREMDGILQGIYEHAKEERAEAKKEEEEINE